MGKNDIIFVFPPGPGSAGKFKNHLGAAYLRAALARQGIRTAQYLDPDPGTIDEVAASIIRHRPRLVGFTVYDSNARLSIAIAQTIKRQLSGVHIVFGGPTATFSARPLMDRHPAVDVCVMGEAEETAATIFTKLLDGIVLDEAQAGIVFRRDGEVVCATPSGLVGSGQAGVEGALDVTPSPYLTGILADGEEGVLTSRGCTHHCQYCCFAALARKRLRLHSMERVLAELECIAENQKRTGHRHPVKIQDDTFALQPARAKSLCQAIADRKLNLTLLCSTRADTVDEELVRLMREAGFRGIAFGLESAVPSVLRATGKVRPPDWHDPDLSPEKEFVDRIRSSVLLAKKYGLEVAVSIILGLPSETPADGAETLRFVRELQVDSYVHNFLWVYPGTPLWSTHDQYAIDCGRDNAGMPTTKGYSYDVTSLKPAPKCRSEEKAKLVRLLATDALWGCDSSVGKGHKGIGAVTVTAGELSPEVAEWLRAILIVGGIVVQVYPAMKRGSEWLRLQRDRQMLSEHLVPAQHHIQVLPKTNRTTGRDSECWQVACAGVDVYRTHKPALLSIRAWDRGVPLMDWAKNRPTKMAACEMSEWLQRPGELAPLRDRIKRQDTSSLQRMPIPPQVKYPGRWLRGRAPCLSLPRIEVSDCGEVRCCRQGKPIGRVGDSPAAMVKRLAHQARAAEERRGCAQCRNTRCARCPFPGVDDRTYCQIMTRQERALELLDWMWLYSQLPLLLALQRNG